MTALTDETYLESLCDEVDGVYRKYLEGGVACDAGVRAALQQTRSVLSSLRPSATAPAAALRASVAVAQVNDLLGAQARSGAAPPVRPEGAPPTRPEVALPPCGTVVAPRRATAPRRRAVPAGRTSRALIVAAVAVGLALAFAVQVAFSSTDISHEPPSRPGTHATHAAPNTPHP